MFIFDDVGEVSRVEFRVGFGVIEGWRSSLFVAYDPFPDGCYVFDDVYIFHCCYSIVGNCVCYLPPVTFEKERKELEKIKGFYNRKK